MTRPTEAYYVWKEWSEEDQRLLTPWGNPYEHEHPFDFLFSTIEEAQKAKAEDEDAAGEDWILCRETLKPIDIGS